MLASWGEYKGFTDLHLGFLLVFFYILMPANCASAIAATKAAQSNTPATHTYGEGGGSHSAQSAGPVS